MWLTTPQGLSNSVLFIFQIKITIQNHFSLFYKNNKSVIYSTQRITTSELTSVTDWQMTVRRDNVITIKVRRL
jgi:hypothetical protein